MTPGKETFDKCPVCASDARVEHGRSPKGPIELWHCPECGDWLSRHILTELPVVQSPRGVTHAVGVSGGGANGGLFGVFTLCGLSAGKFQDQIGNNVTCGNCKRVIAAHMVSGEAS